MRKLLNVNMLGAAFLVTAFALSLLRVLSIARQSSEGALGEGRRIVRITHWQLEPGYRQAMDWAIAKYNDLPKVKAAGVEVRQEAVTERVYAQMLNVHVVSGTAPDICERGRAAMVVGTDFIAQFFEPLDDYANVPNPYNAPANFTKEVRDDMLSRMSPEDAQELMHLLATAAWRETFVDGMRGGWNDDLQSQYAVPTSFWGGLRIYYNRRIVAEVEQLIARDMAKTPRPAWLAKVFDDGWLTDTPELRQWLEDPDRLSPRTLGRLMLLCAGVRQYAIETNNPRLAPIAGSSYSKDKFARAYLVPFTSAYAAALDTDLNSTVDALETVCGWQRGVWSFDDERMKAYFECLQAICRQFPPGFLGLDREMANRRFVLGNAAMIVTGAWDATSLFAGADECPNGAFEIGITRFPIPGPGEKWYDLVSELPSEASADAGAPFEVYQKSPNKEWAIDFLRFLTSYPINQEFNRRAGWCPCIVGSTPAKRMMPFMPNPNGIASDQRVYMTNTMANIGTTYRGQLDLLMSGDEPYASFKQAVVDAMNKQRVGVDRMWYDEWVKRRDAARNQDRMLAVLDARLLYAGNPDTPQGRKVQEEIPPKYHRGLLKSLRMQNGQEVPAMWHRYWPDQPFPEY